MRCLAVGGRRRQLPLTVSALLALATSSLAFAEPSPRSQQAGYTMQPRPQREGLYAAPPALPAADVPRPQEPAWDEHHGLLGPLRLGPVIGTGLPNVLSLGVTSKLGGYVGLGFNYGMIPDLQLSFYGDATVKYREFDVYARVYPLKGGFFVGMGVGQHSARGTIVNDLNIPTSTGSVVYTLVSTGSVRSTIITPQLGYFRNFAFGLALGIDIGVQIPVASSDITFDSGVPSYVPSQYVEPVEQQVVDTLRRVGKTPIPAINLRAGWML